MPKLNQIIAVVQGKKSRSTKLLTDAHHGWNKDAISGVTRTYTPKTEGGDPLPAESKIIHLDIPTKLQETLTQMSDFWDAVLTQEKGNTDAKASIHIDGRPHPVLKDVPVTVLLFLEKQLVDLHTFASNLPTLPMDKEWKWDSNRNCYVTEPIQSIRTQKVPKVIVKYEATKEHPAQTEMFSEDNTVGTWATTYMSSAIPNEEKAGIVSRIEALQDAVKSAREEANSREVQQERMAENVVNFIFGDLKKSSKSNG